MGRDTLGIVIPVYNEESCIGKVIEDWGQAIEKLDIDFKIILVNDGSTDNTSQILNRLSHEHPELITIHQENQGHGNAVKNGYIAAVAQNVDYIFQTDSDDQFTSEDFSKFWERRHESPAIFGHRQTRKDPLHRKVISFFLRKFLFDFFETDIPDANIPYRLFKTDFLRSALACLTPGVFAPNIFLSILCFKSLNHCPVIPVQHFARETNAKLVRWSLIKACFNSLWDLIVFSYQLKKKVQYIHGSIDDEKSLVLPTREDLNIAA